LIVLFLDWIMAEHSSIPPQTPESPNSSSRLEELLDITLQRSERHLRECMHLVALLRELDHSRPSVSRSRPLHNLLMHVAASTLAELDRSVETLAGLQTTVDMCTRGVAAEVGIKPSVLLDQVSHRLALHEFYELTERQWSLVEPLIGKTRNSAHHRRDVLNGILWVLCTGSAWESMPPDYAPFRICHGVFTAWCRSGVMDRIGQALSESVPGIAEAIATRRMKPRHYRRSQPAATIAGDDCGAAHAGAH
jgi:transposase